MTFVCTLWFCYSSVGRLPGLTDFPVIIHSFIPKPCQNHLEGTGDENVLGLDIAVDQAAAVDHLKASKEGLEDQRHCELFRHASASMVLAHVLVDVTLGNTISSGQGLSSRS
jgi:hypothetical protein